jgi:CRP/FNR family cyclic AMP-dependent transcriptional regulator
MSVHSKYWYLLKFNLFRRLKRKELMYLCDTSLMKKYKAKDVLKHEYDNNKFIYFLKNGTLKLTRINNEGKELLTYLMPKGSIFGIEQLLTDQYAGNEKIEAVNNCIVCRMGIEHFRMMMEKNSDLNNHVLSLSGFKIKKLENKLDDIIFKSADQRVREFIVKFSLEYGENKGAYHEVKLFLANKDIAALTNTNRQKVNLVMNSMKKENLIDFDTKSIKYYN